MLTRERASLDRGLRPVDRPTLRRAIRLALAIAALAALAAGWRVWSHRDAGGVVDFETKPIGRGIIERAVSATGAVKALVTVDVGSQLSGLIAEMKVDFNDPVKEGDLLAVIDRAPYEAKVESAAANLAMARADVGQREAAIAKASTQLAQYRRDVVRHETLAPRGISSQVQRDQAETQSGVATADLAIAQAQLDAAKAAVAQRQAELTTAQIDLDRTLIRSPINGVVIDRKMQPGQTLTAQYQTPVLFQIAQDLAQIQVMAQVDEADVGVIRPGVPVTFSVEAFPDETFTGEVEQIRLAATKISGVVTYTVVIRAKNPGQRLFPEMTATVRIVGGRRENALLAPNEALRFRPPGRSPSTALGLESASLWVLGEDGVLTERSVRTGLKGEGVTEILEGAVHEGEAVAIRAGKGAARPAT
ncbi:efflux RND transporter periplasmic adaptor subunit [Methylocapsa palsarum]|uniref:HlyD family secretion protein n=1 Tax=Methylocapsa palsarum TaxID=1612308 RepID=A0A1I4BKA9_9HYPH|nr:efflux RND transporter periplasmic adaptor subunit [Methylocapsa palsarum]SFK69292.1 HlyD family secretion protein [Methylocapsa palsarum]